MTLGIKFLQTICASVHLHLICPHLLWNIEETEMERERAGDKPAPANQAGVRLTGPSTLTGAVMPPFKCICLKSGFHVNAQPFSGHT